MNIERLAGKLRPLMPEAMDRWLRVRQSADASLRTLIDAQITATARRVFGADVDQQVLLSLPSPSQVAGAFNLGTVLYEKPHGPGGLSHRELGQHLAIFGRSGAGKTNAAFHLVEQLTAQHVPWLFLDWKRTARHLLPLLQTRVNVFTAGRSLLPFPFNPFVVPPGMEPGAYANLVIDLIASTSTLGDAAVSVLHTGLRSCYDRGHLSPTADEIIAEVDRIPNTERVRGWKVSALRALRTLNLGHVSTPTAFSQQEMASLLLGHSTIVELDGLSTGGRQFLVPLLCLWLYSTQLSTPRREHLQLVIFIEEAHHFLYSVGRRSQERVLDMLVRQAREVGIGFVIIDQHPHLISPAALGNTYTSLCFNLKDPPDVARAAGISLLADDEKHYLGLLPVGHAIVKLQDRWRQPFLIRVPHVPIAKGSISDEMLRRWAAQPEARSPNANGPDAGIGHVPRVPDADTPLENDSLRFLEDVVAFPTDWVRRRYERLGWGGTRGNRIQRYLFSRGWLEREVIRVGATRRVVLRLTAQANERLGIKSGVPRESVAHEYWKRWYAQRLTSDGYRAQIEAERHGGRVDVLATRGHERIGIEVETGRSDAVGNVRNCVRSQLSLVLVVATDENAHQIVERQLARSGLLIPNRVRVVLRDQFDQSATSVAA